MQAQDIIREAVADGQMVRLNCGQLDKNVYAEVDAILSCFRGKWVGGKVSAHVFPEPITGQVVIDAIVAGNVPAKNQFSLFQTPDSVIDGMIAELRSYCPDPDAAYRFLEPHGGTGAIARRLRKEYRNSTVDIVEIDPVNIHILKAQGFAPVNADFLTYTISGDYDAVVMNPPFDGNEYVKHIEKAVTLIGKWGCVVTIAPAAVSFNNGALPLLHLIHERSGTIEELPVKSFKESGYSGDTILVTIPGYVPDTIPYTGYASKRIAVLSVAAQNDWDTSEALSAFIRSHKAITLNADGYPGDSFAREVKRIYTGYMMRNRLVYCAHLDEWEWQQLAIDVAEYAATDYGIPVERPALTIAMPAPIVSPVDPTPKRKPKRVESNQISMF